MDDPQRSSLGQYLLGLADDELILGHRDSEWCGLAPILEEDIAFANIALDEIGHANLWYGLIADLIGKDKATYPDLMVFERPAKDYRNVQLVELPKGDWAFSILRQYLFDEAELIRLDNLKDSRYLPISETAAKIRTEEIYHQRHNRLWVKRLGLGTEESHRRMQVALETIWPYCSQLFTPEEDDSGLVQDGIIPGYASTYAAWRETVMARLSDCGLCVPEVNLLSLRRKEHTAHLGPLVAEMQSVRQLDPLAEW